MALDKIKIGVRIRYIREKTFRETRAAFAERCGLTESHMGQIERGEIVPSTKTLDKIASNAGADLNYIMYGKAIKNSVRSNIDFFLDRSTTDELQVYFKCLSTVKNYIGRLR